MVGAPHDDFGARMLLDSPVVAGSREAACKQSVQEPTAARALERVGPVNVCAQERAALAKRGRAQSVCVS